MRGLEMTDYGDICTLFENLSTYQRIEVLSDLLTQCNPVELRFFATFIEDLAKKDYYHLRDDEVMANNPNTLTRLENIFDESTRCRLNIYLALLHSYSVPACSDVVTNILLTIKSKLLYVTSLNNSHVDIDQEFADDVILLLTLGARHPALRFHQRQLVIEALSDVKELLNGLIGNVDDVHLQCPEIESRSAKLTESEVRFGKSFE